MTQVFISYSRKDLAFVERLAKDLKAAGLEVWYDLSGLEIGAHWGMEIQTAIKQSQYIIIVLSPNSILSEWVEREFIYASNHKLKVIPLIHKPCDLPLWSVTMHYIDMQGRNYRRHFGELLQVLGVEPGLDVSAANLEFAAARQAAEEKARLDEQARQKSVAEEKQRKEAEKLLQQAAEEKARLEEQARQKSIAEEKQRQVTEMRLRQEAEEKSRQEQLARQKSAAEEKSRLEAEERLHQKEELQVRRAALELEKSRQELQKRELLAAEIARLQQEIETALMAEQWDRARLLISQLKNQGSEGQALAGSLQRRLPRIRIPIWAWAVPTGLVVIALLGFWLRGYLGTAWLAPSPTPTPTPTSTTTNMPTLTPTLTLTIEPSLTPTITLAPTVAITPTFAFWTRPADKMVMVYVQEGNFSMGSSNNASDEQPVHTVYLDAYWIDKTEITNAMYAQCVKVGVCQPPNQSNTNMRNWYYGYSKYDNYPVIYVNWTDANSYCVWAGARLPTEAEWEKAARGTDGRIFPWGNAAPTCSLANFGGNIGCVGDTSAVGAYPAGASPYGALDLAGNVWEWVNDWYDSAYYASSPASNPQGPSSGTARVLRGGGWDFNGYSFRSTFRDRSDPDGASESRGFRCARSAQ